MLRSSLSAGIAASLISATTGRGALTLKLVLGELVVAARELRVATRELVVATIPETLAAAVLLALASEATVPLRALQKAGAHQPKDECASKHQGRLPSRKILQIRSHRHRVLVPEVVGYLIHLARYRVGNPGNPLLIFRPQVFRGPPERRRDGAELVGELALALAQTRAGPIPGLLQAAAGLPHHLILHLTDLFPGTTAALLTGTLGSGAAGLRVWHRHRVAPLLTVRQYGFLEPPFWADLVSVAVQGRREQRKEHLF